MALRSRVLSPLLAALVALGVYASVSPAETRPARPAGPVVTKVAPLQLRIGQRLRVVGRGFLPGRRRNTVVFKRDGARAIFVKADRATRTELVVVVPDKLLALLLSEGRPTPFRIRVLARRFGARFTPLPLSPRILAALPEVAPPAPSPPARPEPPADCDGDGRLDAEDPDDDDDLLADTEEAGFGTDRCKKDTDGDSLRDVWEIESALDLNLRANFYPGKAPYANPLWSGDAGTDYDQDGMTAWEEHDLWQRAGGGRPLAYSDGDQDTTTGWATSTPVAKETEHLDVDGSGRLTDDEKDFDGDRLTNWDESHGRLRGDWWAAAYDDEEAYFGHGEAASLLDALTVNTSPGRTRAYADKDIDGDGIDDGADDQDHDGYSNELELRRTLALDLDDDGDLDHGFRVNPFNPCLPDANARTCALHPPFTTPWAPFDGSSGDPWVVKGGGADGRDQHLFLTPPYMTGG